MLRRPSRTRKSAAAAKQLTERPRRGKTGRHRRRGSVRPGTFVAALYIQGSQLLVVSAKYAAPPLLTAKLKTKEYRDIYMDLSSASVAGSKVFIIDMNCDGLGGEAGRRCRVQTAGRPARSRSTFDGEWGKAKLTEDAYKKAFCRRGRTLREDPGAADGAGEAVAAEGFLR